MTDEFARIRATEYVLQQYHLSSLQEAQQRLTPTQFESLMRDIEGVQRQVMAQARPAAPVSAPGRGISTPFGPVLPVTGALLAVIWLVYALESALSRSVSTTSEAALAQLGATTFDLFQTGQYWRLLTSCFLHIGIVHIISNSIALIILGGIAERFYGPWRFLGIYLATGVIGSAVGVAFQGGGAGASGAIMGLLGALLAGSFRNRRVIGGALSRAIFSNFAFMLILNLATGFIPGIGWSAHAGGATAGAILALLIPFRSTRYPAAYNTAANAVSIVLIVASLALLTTYPFAH